MGNECSICCLFSGKISPPSSPSVAERTAHSRVAAMGSLRHRHRRIVHMKPSAPVTKEALAVAEVPAEASIRAAAAAAAYAEG